jgi:hypothetical protein
MALGAIIHNHNPARFLQPRLPALVLFALRLATRFDGE